MENKNSQFGSQRNRGFWSKVKEKRFYIVLLCCIMSVSATYFVVSSFQKTPPPTPKTQIITPSTPLPDLTKNFPVETDKASNKTPAPTKAPKLTETNDTGSITTNNKANIVTDSSAPVAEKANAEAEHDYYSRSKTPLSYPVSGEIITNHSSENLVYSKTLDDWRIHEGIDIKAPIGSEVTAADGGIIFDVYTDDFMGITIIIDHQNGLKTVYSNLSNSNLFEKGDMVERGNIISTVGDSALYESGEVGHLHFEVLENEKEIDPMSMLEK